MFWVVHAEASRVLRPPSIPHSRCRPPSSLPLDSTAREQAQKASPEYKTSKAVIEAKRRQLEAWAAQLAERQRRGEARVDRKGNLLDRCCREGAAVGRCCGVP